MRDGLQASGEECSLPVGDEEGWTARSCNQNATCFSRSSVSQRRVSPLICSSRRSSTRGSAFVAVLSPQKSKLYLSDLDRDQLPHWKKKKRNLISCFRLSLKVPTLFLLSITILQQAVRLFTSAPSMSLTSLTPGEDFIV